MDEDQNGEIDHEEYARSICKQTCRFCVYIGEVLTTNLFYYSLQLILVEAGFDVNDVKKAFIQMDADGWAAQVFQPPLCHEKEFPNYFTKIRT